MLLGAPVFQMWKQTLSHPARVVELAFHFQFSLFLKVSKDLSRNPGSIILHKALSLNFLKWGK